VKPQNARQAMRRPHTADASSRRDTCASGPRGASHIGGTRSPGRSIPPIGAGGEVRLIVAPEETWLCWGAADSCDCATGLYDTAEHLAAIDPLLAAVAVGEMLEAVCTLRAALDSAYGRRLAVGLEADALEIRRPLIPPLRNAACTRVTRGRVK
jgi:hypothetical protein